MNVSAFFRRLPFCGGTFINKRTPLFLQQLNVPSSCASQNDLRVNFGLNAAKKIDSVEIRWPSGKVELLKDLEVDEFYAVLEGQGIVPPEKIRPKVPVKP